MGIFFGLGVKSQLNKSKSDLTPVRSTGPTGQAPVRSASLSRHFYGGLVPGFFHGDLRGGHRHTRTFSPVDTARENLSSLRKKITHKEQGAEILG